MHISEQTINPRDRHRSASRVAREVIFMKKLTVRRLESVKTSAVAAACVVS
jgi:hypothetical protein